MIDALREYAEDWQPRTGRSTSSMHPTTGIIGGSVQLVVLSEDDQLRDWLVGFAG